MTLMACYGIDHIDQDCSGADGPGRHRVDAGVDAPIPTLDASAGPDASIDAP